MFPLQNMLAYFAPLRGAFEALRISLSAESDEGCAPLDQRSLFEKSDVKTLSYGVRRRSRSNLGSLREGAVTVGD